MRFFDYELLNYDIGELGIFCSSYILFKFFKKTGGSGPVCINIDIDIRYLLQGLIHGF